MKKKPELSPLPQLLQKKRALAAMRLGIALTRLFHLMYIFVIYPLGYISGRKPLPSTSHKKKAFKMN